MPPVSTLVQSLTNGRGCMLEMSKILNDQAFQEGDHNRFLSKRPLRSRPTVLSDCTAGYSPTTGQDQSKIASLKEQCDSNCDNKTHVEPCCNTTILARGIASRECIDMPVIAFKCSPQLSSKVCRRKLRFVQIMLCH